MKNLTFSFLFVIVLFFAGNAFSQDENWVLAGETDNYRVYVNKDSTKLLDAAGTTYSAWLKLECKTECNDGFKSISYSLQNWVLFCDKKEYYVPQAVDTYTDGEQNIYKYDTASGILENSPGEKVLNYFCNNPESPK